MLKDCNEVGDKGGFLIRNWIGNDHKFLETAMEEKKKDPKKLGEVWRKVLGLNWDQISEAFTFRTAQDDNTR